MTVTLIPTSSEEDWLAARRGGITASEIACVMGLAPPGWPSPYSLYHQKLGNLPPQEETDAMALGKHMESFVAAKFTERYPWLTVTGTGRDLFANPDRPWQMATPDRLACDCPGPDNASAVPCVQPLAVLECKIDGGSDEWGEDGTDEIPVHYRCQVLWQMDVMGVTTGYVACLLWNRRQVRVYELTLDSQAEDDLDLMKDQADSFLARIANGIEPDVDWRPATTLALKHLHPSVEDTDVPVRRMPIIQYRAAVRAYKAAEQRKKAAENRLRQLLGNGHRIVSAHTGEVIARRDVYEQRECVRKACTVDKLVPVKPKEKS